MKQKIPQSPFSTRLSGSAKETELRIRNIFQWKKKRPPVIALLAAVLVVAACGGLVGFTVSAPEDTAQPEVETEINTGINTETDPVTGTDRRYHDTDESYVMDVQYYDNYENYIEIPMLVPPAGEETNEAIAAINQVLTALKGEYRTILDGAVGPEKYGLDGIGNHCLFYPTTTDRYINLLFFREIEVTDMNTGHVLSLVYDKEEKRQVTMEDALALAGVTEQELYDALSAQYDPQLAQSMPNAHVIIQNHALEGFRIDGDGKPVFYLTARSDDADDTVQDSVSGASHLYIWSNGTFTLYDQYTVIDLKPLVPTGETVKLDPPLWCQWYFESGEPEGGFALASTNDSHDVDMWNAYADVLENLVNHYVLPGGGRVAAEDSHFELNVVELADGTKLNQFAVYDADGDGKEELILLHNAPIYAGYSGYVFAYDEATKEIRTQLEEFPMLTFYDNGVVKAGWSHNQVGSREFWPYYLYQYQPDSDSYVLIGGAADGYYGGYYITSEGEILTESSSVDESVYNEWFNSYMGSASELQIPYMALTEENIQSLRTGL
ncbi:MAG: hypothetical protein ACI4O5_01880 [Oscillospiraceae bacterium]